MITSESKKKSSGKILHMTEWILTLSVLVTLIGFQNGIGAGNNQDSIQIDRKVEQLLSQMTLAQKI